MKILVLNAGSSSLKFNLFETSPEQIAAGAEKLLAGGEVERVADMAEALQLAFDQLAPALGGERVEGVGHRIVHGGERFFESVIIGPEVERQIAAISSMAPLHNPHNLAAYRAAREHLPDATHVAVFDTAFHRTMPPRAYRYAIPEVYFSENHIRRYGFHGISHRYVSSRFARIHGKTRADFRMITCHLGNGCSICAIQGGKSIDTSMGFTPLEGLVMGTRSGDIDPGAILHLIIREKEDPAALEKILNGQSGLKGLSGNSSDMRDLEKQAEAGDEKAQLAIDVFCYRVKKYIGAYAAAMNGADALIFTAGIGEHAPLVRERICSELDSLGIVIDRKLNAAAIGNEMQISTGRVSVWVIPTAEELVIAHDTVRVILRLPPECE